MIFGRRAGASAVLLAVCMSCARSPESRRDRFLARGREFAAKHQYAKALLEFRNASREMPRDPESYYQAGMVDLAARDLVAAASSFREALSVNPNYTKAKLILAEMMTVGDRKLVLDAETSISEMLHSAPPTPEMLDTLAATQLRLNRTDAAIEILEQVLAKSPGEAVTAILLAQVKLNQGDEKGAQEVLKQACQASPNTLGLRLALARLYMETKRPKDAEQELLYALRLNPKSEVALRELAILQDSGGRRDEADRTFKQLASVSTGKYKPIYALFLFSTGRRDAAVREFERLTAQNPEDQTVRDLLVMSYEAVNRRDEAGRILAQVLSRNPHDVEALMMRGALSIQEAKFAEAETVLNRALNLEPESAGIHYELAKLHQLRGETPSYKSGLFKVLDLNPHLLSVRLELAGVLEPGAALEVLDKAPTEQQTSLQFCERRNWALWGLGYLSEMRKGIDRGLSMKRSLDLLIQDGLWNLKEGNPSKARASIEEALHINPTDIRGLSALQNSYLQQHDSSAAVAKVKAYARMQPQSAPVQEFLGFTMWGAGDRTAARAAFNAAAASDPEFAGAHFALAQLDALDRNWGAAVGQLDSVVAFDPRNAKALLWLGNIETLQGKQTAATEHFRKVVELQPDNADALNNLAYLLAEQSNDLDQPLSYAERAVKLAPSDPAFADTLGWILYRKGLYHAAIPYLERAAAGDDDVVPKYHLALAYGKNGNIEQGRAVFNVASKRNAKVPEAGVAAQVLFGAK
jgi:tetratricopeptide (TPR) repeat protein